MTELRLPIRALIFDFGGVLVRTASRDSRDRLAASMGLTGAELEAVVFESEEGHLAELGRISSEERWRRVCDKLGVDSPEERQAFPQQFFAGEVLDPELVDNIRRLHERYKTALLSNASDSLANYIYQTLHLSDAFDAITISAQVGLSKPDPRIFRLVLEQLQVAPSEAVFVDDRQENVEAAASLGIHAIQFTTREALLAELGTLLQTPALQQEPRNAADKTGMVTIRGYRAEDLKALVQLINDADQVDDAGFATTEEAMAHDLADPRVDPSRDVALAESQGRLVGYVRLLKVEHDEYDRVVVRGMVHPGWRRQGVGATLMGHAEERAGKLKTERPMVLHLSARERVCGTAELALSLGFRTQRYFFYMECHNLEQLPEPAFPAGIRLRDYVIGCDDEPFVLAHNDGFADHWAFAALTLVQEEHRSSAPGFRAQDNLLAVGADGLIVGFCVLQLAPAGPDQNDSSPPLIDDLAVRPAYRRRGIGTALLLAAMQRVRSAGQTTVSLVVDADNPNQALRLYDSVGFAVQSRTTMYQKQVL